MTHCELVRDGGWPLALKNLYGECANKNAYKYARDQLEKLVEDIYNNKASFIEFNDDKIAKLSLASRLLYECFDYAQDIFMTVVGNRFCEVK